MLPLIKRLRIRRECFELRRKYLADGVPPHDANDLVLSDMHEKYGLDLDWEKILEIVLMILDLLLSQSPAPTPDP